MHRLSLAAIALIIGFACAPLSGEDYVRPGRVTVSSVPVPGTESSSIGAIIRDAASLQMHLDNYDVTQTDGAPRPEDLKDSDYLLENQYSIEGNTVSVDIQALEAGSGDLLASGSWSGPLDLDLDDSIQAIIRKDILPALPPVIPMSRRQTEKAAADGEEWAEEALSVSETSSEESEEEAGEDEKRKSDNSTGHWVLETGGFVYIPLTDTATYAEIGYGGRLVFGYAFGGKTVSLSPRLVAAGIWLPTDTVRNTDLMLIPIGAELKISSIATVLAPYIRLGGGVTWLMLLPEDGDSEGKLIPYAEAGLGIDILFGNTVGIALDVAFSIQIEETVILYGIAPGLDLSFRF